jgi:hypothetical protein
MLRGSLKNCGGFFQFMEFDEGSEHHLASEHQLQSGGILVWGTAPITARGGVECHQIREAQFDRLGCVSDYRKVRTMINQSKGSALPSGSAAHFENFQADAFESSFLAEGSDCGLQALQIRSARIEDQPRAMKRCQLEALLININGDHRCAQRCSDLHRESSDATDANYNGYILWP